MTAAYFKCLQFNNSIQFRESRESVIFNRSSKKNQNQNIAKNNVQGNIWKRICEIYTEFQNRLCINNTHL